MLQKYFYRHSELSSKFKIVATLRLWFQVRTQTSPMNSNGRLMEMENGSHALYCYLLTAHTQLYFFDCSNIKADFQKTHLPSSLSLMVFLAGPYQQQWKLAESRQQRIDEDCFRIELFPPHVTPRQKTFLLWGTIVPFENSYSVFPRKPL